VPTITIEVDALKDTVLKMELRISSKIGNYTPDITLETKTIDIQRGRRKIKISFTATLSNRCYVFIIFHKNTDLGLYRSNQRVTGILSAFNSVNKAVSNFGKQTPPADIGMDEFEFWCPQRRPDGQNVAMQIDPPLQVFAKEAIKSGVYRPTTLPNAWVADFKDPAPQVKLSWEEPQEIRRIDLFFDTDYDHPMESVLMGHPEDVMLFCVRNYKILDDIGQVVVIKEGNYQSNNRIEFQEPVVTASLVIQMEHPSAQVPASLFSIRCYS